MSDKMNPTTPILMIDDEEPWLQSCKLVLEYEANIDNVKFCTDSRKAMDMIGNEPFSLVLLDLTMPNISGKELLANIKENYPDLPVIVLSGMNEIKTAVDCMKLGAYDYFVKTDEKERLLSVIKHILEFRNLQIENQSLRKSLFLKEDTVSHPVFDAIKTNSQQIRTIFKYIEAIVKSSEPIFLIGESGVGKELFARAIHELSRPDYELVTFNVAGVDETVFSDTLFGHEKGAFTGAASGRPGLISRAGSGSVLLDEIGDLEHSTQVKLLRLLQDGEYYPLGADAPRYSQARFICATNQDLAAKLESKEFRRDLFYRLSTHQVIIPPLRERPEDIELLLNHFISEASMEMSADITGFHPEILHMLMAYDFPGNVRELRSIVYDAVSRQQSGELDSEFFIRKIGGINSPTDSVGCVSPAGKNIYQGVFPLPSLTETGELLVEEAMARAGNNQTIAAGMLGITRQALGKRLRKNK